MKKALIFGITGQDGSYLSELLLEKGYEVHGVIRRSSSFNTGRIDHIFEKLNLHHGDVTDPLSTSNLISSICPDEIYNLAAQSHVKVSFDQPYYTGQVDALGVMTILEAVRVHCPNTKVYQASTSELYGGIAENMSENGFNEDSKLHPRSPYGVAKIYGYWATKNYREAYDMFCCNGILFNHESERRGETFVTRKVTIGLTNISKGIDKKLLIGNLDAKRDWGHAKDYVYGMYLMLQQDSPKDYVLSSNSLHSVRDFIELSCKELGWEIEWKGNGDSEIGILLSINDENPNVNVGDVIIEVDSKYYRPSEVDILLGDSSKAREELGWIPEHNFESIVKEMIISDLSK